MISLNIIYQISVLLYTVEIVINGTAGDPVIGVATDQGESSMQYDSVDTSPKIGTGEEIYHGESYQEPQIGENQEISSPAHIILPGENTSEERRTSSSSHDETAPPLTPNSTESDGQVNNMDAIFLSLLRMGMNQSEGGHHWLDVQEETHINGNQSDLTWLYRTEVYDAYVTTASIDVNSEYDTITTVKNGLEDGFNISELALGDTERNNQEVQPFDRSELLFLEPPPMFIPEHESHVIPSQGNHSADPSKTELQDMDIMEKGLRYIDSRIFLPGKNLTIVANFPGEIAKLDAPDITPSLSRCGVFPACKLHLTAAADIINFNADAYTLGFGGVITQEPTYLGKLLEITCDPTSVSIIIAFAIVLVIVIVISNIVIIFVTLRTKSLRKPHGYFKVSLAVADFLTGAFVLTNVSSNMIRFIHFNDSDINQLIQLRRLEPNYSEAAFFGIVAVLSQVVTVYSVLLLSVDSFLSIRWPMQYRVGDLMTPKRSWILIAIVWVFGLAVSIIPILADEYVQYGLSYSTFSFLPILDPIDGDISQNEAFVAQYIHVLLYAVLVFGIPFVATWILTLMTAYHSRGMLKHMRSARKKPANVTKKIGRLERDIQRTVAIVLVMLTITVLPLVVVLILVTGTVHNNKLCLEKNLMDGIFAGYYILVCGSFINVIVYNACHKEFRRATFEFLCDVVSFTFGKISPEFCDLRSKVKSKSFRSKSSSNQTRRTTISSEKKCKNTISNNERANAHLKGVSKYMEPRSNTSNGYSAKSEYYSDIQSSSRTTSTDTTTSSRNRSISTDSNGSSHVLRKIPVHRASSCGSVFTSSNNVALKANTNIT